MKPKDATVNRNVTLTTFGFTLGEMLVALTMSAMLLAAIIGVL